MRKKLTISIDESLEELMDERARTENLTRSGYLRMLILKDIENLLAQRGQTERRKTQTGSNEGAPIADKNAVNSSKP